MGKTLWKYSSTLAQIVKSTAIGSSAGIVGSLIPNTSAWHMLLIGGALVGAAKEAPNLVRSIVDTILEDSKGRRSSIAYIARFK